MMSLLFKLVYSVLLLGVAVVAARELWTVWFDKRVYIGAFDVVSESGKDAEGSSAFSKRLEADDNSGVMPGLRAGMHGFASEE